MHKIEIVSIIYLSIIFFASSRPENKYPIEFEPADSYSVAAKPMHMAAGDFNKDGHEDVAVTHDNANYSILINQGDGTFVTTSYSLGNRLRDVAVVMLAGDTILDLVFSDYSYGGVRVLTGLANGTFSLQASIPTGNGAEGVSVGDFNQDGVPDVALCNRLESTVGILLGNTGGYFNPATTYPAGGDCMGMNVGLVDSDSIQDIVTGNLFSHNISVLIGDGTGGFGSASMIDTGHENYKIALGDINNDLYLDAAVGTYSDYVHIYLGDGLGGFSLGQAIPASGGSQLVVDLADLNSDGWLDIVATHTISPPALSIIISDGAGGFETPVTFHEDIKGWGMVLADFNSDNQLDIATSHKKDNLVRVLLSKPETDGDGMPNSGEDLDEEVSDSAKEKNNSSDLVFVLGALAVMLVILVGAGLTKKR